MIKAVKGTRDILPPSSAVWNQVEAVAREVFRIYNYQEIRTPILEETALFARGVGQETDIVSKEMYTFDDRDGSSLTLRPEATASVMRAYIEHRLDQKPGLQKLYYIGPMFRRERPQKGRYRQFYQIGAEAIGSESPSVDARSDRDGDRSASPGGAGRLSVAASIRWAIRTAARSMSRCSRKSCAKSPRACATIASGARRPILCACWIARCRKIRPSSTRCRPSRIICAIRAARTSMR